MKCIMLNPGHKATIFSVAVLLLGMGSSAAWAHPPRDRLDPDERQRLRQELRQHRGDYQQVPAGNVPPAQYPPNAMPAYPMPPNQIGPSNGGRMNDYERQQLRQQLREQKGRQGWRRDYPGYPAALSPNGP